MRGSRGERAPARTRGTDLMAGAAARLRGPKEEGGRRKARRGSVVIRRSARWLPPGSSVARKRLRADPQDAAPGSPGQIPNSKPPAGCATAKTNSDWRVDEYNAPHLCAASGHCQAPRRELGRNHPDVEYLTIGYHRGAAASRARCAPVRGEPAPGVDKSARRAVGARLSGLMSHHLQAHLQSHRVIVICPVVLAL